MGTMSLFNCLKIREEIADRTMTPLRPPPMLEPPNHLTQSRLTKNVRNGPYKNAHWKRGRLRKYILKPHVAKSPGKFVPPTIAHWHLVKRFAGTRVGCKCKMCLKKTAIYSQKKLATWKQSLCQDLCPNLIVSKFPKRFVSIARPTHEL